MLTIIDLIVTASFLLIPAILGCMYCISTRSYNELALGDRKLGIVPVAFSTVIGFLVFNQNVVNVGVGDAYYNNPAHMLTTAGTTLLAIALSMVIFVPVLQKLKLVSVFGYLELRFQSVVLRWVTSLAFIVVTIIVAAFMTRLTSTLIHDIFGLPMLVSVLTIGLSATIYSALGGLPLAVFYHSFLTLALLSAMTIITVKGTEGTTGGFPGVVKSRILQNSNFKFNFVPDPFSRSNDLNILLGYGFSLTCLYGIHQSQFQRYSAISSKYRKIQIALGLSILVAILLLTLFTLMTLSIVSSYCDSRSIDPYDIDGEDQYPNSNFQQFAIMLTYIIDQLKTHYGVNGLFIAATASFVLSLLASVMNSLAVTTTEDFVKKLPRFRQCADSTYAYILRAFTIFYGVLITGLSLVPIEAEPFVIMLPDLLFITIAVIGSIFLLGMFIPFANKYGAGIGFFVGLFVAVGYNVETHFKISSEFGWIPSSSKPIRSVSFCRTDFNNSTVHYVIDSDGWPTALLHISGHLHPALGAIVVLVVSIIASSLTGGCCQHKHLNPQHFHPIVRLCMSKRKESLSDEHSDKPLLRNPVVNSHRNVDRLSGFPLSKGTSNFSLFHQRYETMSLNEVAQ